MQGLVLARNGFLRNCFGNFTSKILALLSGRGVKSYIIHCSRKIQIFRNHGEKNFGPSLCCRARIETLLRFHLAALRHSIMVLCWGIWNWSWLFNGGLGGGWGIQGGGVYQ